MTEHGRRDFIVGISSAALLGACGGATSDAATTADEVIEQVSETEGTVETVAVAEPTVDLNQIPAAKPADWDAMAFNRARGATGAIPAAYMITIEEEGGDVGHLGKHLPFVPEFEAPAGKLALMWGDPAKGHAQHPNADRAESNNNEGHWYNWIRVRKATADAQEVETTFDGWPAISASTGSYAVLGGGDIAENGGKNTVYLVELPSDVASGDTVRVHAHCLTHGEYVDFVVVP